jgi:hypothetical protein
MAMVLDIEFYRERVGLQNTDNSKDADIEMAKQIAADLVDEYCDRWFAESLYTETFTHYSGETIQLKAYPVAAINSIKGASFKYHLDAIKGLINVDGWAHNHQIEIEYTGGYAVLPDAVQYATLMVFDAVWEGMQGQGSVSTGGIKNIKAGDISITYDSSGSSDNTGGAVPLTAIGILDKFMRVMA